MKELHRKHLNKVFAQIREFGFKVKEAKFDFCMKKIKYLWHIIDKNGRRRDPKGLNYQGYARYPRRAKRTTKKKIKSGDWRPNVKQQYYEVKGWGDGCCRRLTHFTIMDSSHRYEYWAISLPVRQNNIGVIRTLRDFLPFLCNSIFLCNIICYLISVFVFSLVTPSRATTNRNFEYLAGVSLEIRYACLNSKLHKR